MPSALANPRFYELLDEIRKLHDAKDSDYSKKEESLSNFRVSEQFGIPPWMGVLVRISDKFSRISRLSSKILNHEKVEVKGESIKDTLMDMSVYSLIAIILYEEWDASWKKAA